MRKLELERGEATNVDLGRGTLSSGGKRRRKAFKKRLLAYVILIINVKREIAYVI